MRDSEDISPVTLRLRASTKRRLTETARRLDISVNELACNLFDIMTLGAAFSVNLSRSIKSVAAEFEVHPATVKRWIADNAHWVVENRGNPGMRIPQTTVEEIHKWRRGQ